jgi:hypothetical protein
MRKVLPIPPSTPLPLEAITPHYGLAAPSGDGSHILWTFHPCNPELERFCQPASLSIGKRAIVLHGSQGEVS